MLLQNAQIMALDLMYKHGLTQEGWTFAFDNAKRRLGVCNYTNRQIGLSRYLVVLNEEAQVRETILHEIAHALSMIRYGRKAAGHGPLWKKVCEEIGAKPERCCASDEVTMPRGSYILRHIETGEVFREYYQKPKRDLSRTWIRGRKEETYGKLEVIQVRPDPKPRTPSVTPSKEWRPRWVIRHKETGEVFAHYQRRPTVDLSVRYIRGRKRETLGKLEVAPADAPAPGQLQAAKKPSQLTFFDEP